MTAIRPLTTLDLSDLQRLVSGYTSYAKYTVERTSSEHGISFHLALIELPAAYRKYPQNLDQDTIALYRHIAPLGFSFGAYDGSTCVGIVLAEPRTWNRSLWVYELHVADTHRRQGIGRVLIDALWNKGRESGLRTLVCETQSTNVPAILFYRSEGFEFEGLDLSYYTNEDFPDGEIAIFMKKRLE